MLLQNERKALGDWFANELNTPAKRRPYQERKSIMFNLKKIFGTVVRFAVSNLDQANINTRARMVDEFRPTGGQ
ncbi:MAG TPA: hypothetical protein VMU31_07080 [Rhizomicrobium sp.]|nr:hypothetical protein [Rhizomicrobium sp.]